MGLHRPMRVGIMSFAHMHAEGYTTALRSLPGVELVGFSDEDRARGERYSKEYGLQWFESHEELLAQIDAAVVCSENWGRLELVEQAAAAGVHVLCEKPVEVSLERSQRMGDVCKEAGVRFMTAFPMRFDPSVRSVREALQRGDLGRLYGVNGINHAELPSRHRAWFAQRELAGGGAVMDHTVHLVDLLRWFLGAEVDEVYAEIGTPFHRDEVDVDSAGLLSLRFTDGTFAAIDCSWSRPAGYPRWGHLKMELVGEEGAISLDAFAQALTVYSGSQASNPMWHNWGSDANAEMLKEFLAAVREGREPVIGWEDGHEALRVTLACYQSARLGEPVKL